MEDILYREHILEHYRYPQNKRILKDYSFKKIAVNPNCGDVITLYVDCDGTRLKDISFDGEGCAISIAATSILTENVKGKKLKNILNIASDDMFSLIGVKVNPVREKCALLSLETLKQAIKDI